jgi:hypothetical protein
VRVDSWKVQGLFSKRTRPNRYVLIRTVGSGSSGTNQRGAGIGSPAAAIARRRPLPWRRLAGDGRSRPSGPHFGRALAQEVKHGTANTIRHLRKLIRVRAGAPHDGGGAGSRQRGGRARAAGEGERKRARRVPYVAEPT